MPRREIKSWYTDDDWRLRVSGSNPADEDFIPDFNYVDPEGVAWLITYPPTSSTARANARWQWFVLLMVTAYQHWPAWDYASRYIAAFHNPLRP